MFLCCGTDQGETRKYSYTVINESGKSIRVKSFFTYNPSITPIITSIQIGQEITKTHTDYPPYNSEFSFQHFFGERRDSIVVIYNDEKIESFIYECDSNESNPLNFCVYNKLEEVFIITEEDYNNAEDCNGDCE